MGGQMLICLPIILSRRLVYLQMARTKAFDRDEVLTKAMNLFWKKGYYATSIQDLVDHLGINRGSIYDTFVGKDELYQEAIKLYRSQNAEALKQFLNEHDSVKEGIHALMLRNLNQVKCDTEKKGCFMVNCSTEYLPTHPSAHSIVEENKKIFIATLFGYLQSGVDSGELAAESNPQSLANFIFTFINGMMVVSKTSKDYSQLNKSINMVMELL